MVSLRREQGCSMLYGNALIRPVIDDIANPDLKSPSYPGLIHDCPARCLLM